ncbi:MAG: hypothetical protein IPG00_20975 [Saprospiraceae bacterium]|nr:hypothetical protein [Saprospiraceae bacterium]
MPRSTAIRCSPEPCASSINMITSTIKDNVFIKRRRIGSAAPSGSDLVFAYIFDFPFSNSPSSFKKSTTCRYKSNKIVTDEVDIFDST